jgi:hypothetical protein
MTVESSRQTFASALRQTIAAYRQIGTQVVLSRLPSAAGLSRTRCGDSVGPRVNNSVAVPLAKHQADQRWSAAVLSQYDGNGAVVLNFDDACDGRICPIARNGKLLYFDDDHLSIEGPSCSIPSSTNGLSGHF